MTILAQVATSRKLLTELKPISPLHSLCKAPRKSRPAQLAQRLGRPRLRQQQLARVPDQAHKSEARLLKLSKLRV